MGYVGAQIGIWLGALFLSFRMLASALGYQVPKGGDGE